MLPLSRIRFRLVSLLLVFFFKQKTAYEMRISDWSSDVCSSDLVSIVRYTAVQDVGRAIHADYVEGQIQGGVAQGVGWALNETYIYNKDGRLDNPGFLDYRMPVASDMPMIDTDRKSVV